MVALLRRVQTQGFCLYRPQQPLSIHRHKEFKLQTSPLGSETFSISLPNGLPPGQSKWSCWCFVTISSAECWGKRHPPLQKRQDLTLPVVLAGHIIWSFGRLESTFPSLPDLYMWNNCSSSTESVLELFLKRNSSWQSLYYQHWKYEATTLQAAGKPQGSKASQRLCRPFGGLKRRRRSAPISRTPIHPSHHLFQGDKSLLQWSSCKAFRYWQDKEVGWPEILLAKPNERRWELCQRMQRLFGFKSRPLQVLLRPEVLAYTNSLMEGPFYGLRNRLTIVCGLEGRQLQLDPYHCQPVD